MEQKPPKFVIGQLCQQRGVSHQELIERLMVALAESYILNATKGFAGATRHTDAVDEIKWHAAYNSKQEFPKTVLEAIELMVQTNHKDRCEKIKQGNLSPEILEIVKRKAWAEETLLLIIREVANQSETASLETRLMLEGEIQKGNMTALDESWFRKTSTDKD